MIELYNLRTETEAGYIRLVCDCDNDICQESTIWFSVPEQYRSCFREANYDSFLVGILYSAMYFREDILIKGDVSEDIYKNITKYVMAILKAYSNELCDIGITVQGFSKNIICEREFVGTGFSAGVDSFSTIFDYMVNELDTDYKINALFLFNVGSHGKFSDPLSHKKFINRYNLLKDYPQEKNIPFIPVDSNLHAYHEIWGHQKSNPLTLISAVLALQGNLKRYYIASAVSYKEMNDYIKQSENFDLAEYSETYLVPLFCTQNIKIIPDGNQYRRTEKTQNISQYSDTYKYLNVCVSEDESAMNCSHCEKCLRTLMALESIDMLEAYSAVFDLDIYKKYQFKYKCKQVFNYNRKPLAKDNVDFARANGKKLPPYIVAFAYSMGGVLLCIVKKVVRKLIGKEYYGKLKMKFKGK